jgi:hypothetical protein
MRPSRLLKLLVALALIFALCGVYLQASPDPLDIQAVLSLRADAVNRTDGEEYLSTVLPSDAALLKEESNLIRSAAGLGISDYTAVAGEFRRVWGGFVAPVTQSYTLSGQTHDCSYDALFLSEGGKLYYDGPAFLLKENSRVKVFYPQGFDEAAQVALGAETAVLDEMRDQLGFEPNGPVNIKIYADQQVFLQSVKLDLPSWVGGWQEYGEAIKFFAGAYPADGDYLQTVLAHETTHRRVSELSNDNAAYWLQEGLAEVNRYTLGAPGQPLLTKQEAAMEFTPFGRQKGIDLEKIGAGEGGDVTGYYATSRAFAAFLLDRSGWGGMRQALEYMKKYPYIPVTGEEKMAETNARTDEAMKSIFGFNSDDEFQQAFDAWLNKLLSQ